MSSRAIALAVGPYLSQQPQAVANLSKDGVREAQLELRHSGLYNGSLDGVIGPQTHVFVPPQ